LKRAAKKIDGMLAENTGPLLRAWRSRLDDEPVIAGSLAVLPDDEMLNVLMTEFREAFCVGTFSTAVPTLAAQMQMISGCGDPREDAAIWIEVLSAGRAVLEAFLLDVVLPGLEISPARREAILDELERAFHMVAHRRIQVLCDFCLTLR